MFFGLANVVVDHHEFGNIQNLYDVVAFLFLKVDTEDDDDDDDDDDRFVSSFFFRLL